MPVVVWVLGCAIFVQGTSELMIAGLLPELAADLNVSISDSGLLISAFAVGMLLGAPTLTVLTRRWPPRTALLVFAGVFAAAHVAGALASDYVTLLLTRVLGAFVYAGFWAVAAATAVAAVPGDARGRAMSIVAGGLTVAVLIGLPAGTAVGQALGWRAAFWIVAVASALLLGALAWTVPGGKATPPHQRDDRLRAELRVLRRPALLLAYATTALATAALLATYSYLAPVLTEVTGLPAGWVPVVLALYGIGALLGITVGGRLADRASRATLVYGFSALIVVSAALAAAANLALTALPLVFLLGAIGFGTNPALQTRVFGLAERAPTLAAAGNVAAFNVGITVGPWLGGLVLGAGYQMVALVGAGLAAAALVVTLVGTRQPATADLVSN